MSKEEIINNYIEKIRVNANEFPGIVMIHNAQNNFQRLEYINNRGLKFLEADQEYLTALGAEYYVKYFNQIDIYDVIDGMVSMLARKNKDEVYSFFQQARPNENVDWTWFLVSMKILAFDVEGDPLITISNATEINPLYSVTYKVNKVLEEKTFTKDNKDLFDNLTIREKEILNLVSNGLTSEDIATKLFISIETVKTHRKNIISKLGTNSLAELQNFARAFDLI